ncbi:hypothetical protein [uncultured Endozoicomonas sp.]|uniref:hypothetical protein n=1 Tax=uncultured Endozoicomonas sp. TaxID=432652 RepID=UPI00261EC3B3|nr:hypothetical protein [uncultured Endozoicomonas sp.]
MMFPEVYEHEGNARNCSSTVLIRMKNLILFHLLSKARLSKRDEQLKNELLRGESLSARKDKESEGMQHDKVSDKEDSKSP